MIDWVTAVVPVQHKLIQGGTFMQFDEDAVHISTGIRSKKIIGSHSAEIQVQTNMIDESCEFGSHLYINGNPSKFLQGHNVVGTDDLCGLVLGTVEKILNATGCEISDTCRARIKAGQFEVKRLDINYMFELPSHNDVLTWISSASVQSRTRHGRPKAYGSSIYWGLGSRRWMLKAYSKYAEITSGKKAHKLHAEFMNSALLPYSQNKLRIELQLRTLELKKICQNLHKSRFTYAKYFNENTIKTIFNDYLGRIEMNKNCVVHSSKALELPQSCIGTYTLWEQGYNVRGILSRPTFYRHRKIIKESLSVDIDLPRSGQDFTPNNVVPLLRELVAQPHETPKDLNQFIYKYAAN